MTIHVIHVSGKRMITQGTDECSRGLLMEGVMTGHICYHLLILVAQQSNVTPQLLTWIRSWMGQPKLEALTPKRWCKEGHGITKGTLGNHKVWIPVHEQKNQLHLWSPQPPVADAALENLLKARYKRTDTFHVMVVPRLMAPRW